MPYETDAARPSRLGPVLDPGELDRTDRILLGACAAIWLVALGAGVAAVVALVDLGRGHAESSGDSGAPWLLYTPGRGAPPGTATASEWESRSRSRSSVLSASPYLTPGCD